MGIIPITMNGTIILFRMPPKTPTRLVNQFCKKFYGQDTSSHHGKYRYHRNGLLDDIPHQRLIRQVIIVRTEDSDKVVRFLKENKAKIYVRVVILTKDDINSLGLSSDSDTK